MPTIDYKEIGGSWCTSSVRSANFVTTSPLSNAATAGLDSGRHVLIRCPSSRPNRFRRRYRTLSTPLEAGAISAGSCCMPTADAALAVGRLSVTRRA